MKKILISHYGHPERAASCVDCPEVGAPAADEVVFEVLAFPINPADISFCQGRYRLKPELPATPGAEAVGRVISVGQSVTGVKVGDLVANLDRENWAQRRRVRADRVIVLPRDTNVLQAAMIRINPPTAMLLLSDVVDLEPRDWIIQNVANSSVGKLVIAFAKERGLRTVNVTRREDVVEELYSLGADACVLDGSGLAASVADFTKDAPVRLGIDAVGGRATARLAACVTDGGTVCTYGAMSGEDVAIPPSELIFRGLEVKGFLLGRYLERRSPAQIREIYSAIAENIRAGLINVPVEQVYEIDDITAALAHAQRPSRGGKVLVAPNGMDVLSRTG